MTPLTRISKELSPKSPSSSPRYSSLDSLKSLFLGKEIQNPSRFGFRKRSGWLGNRCPRTACALPTASPRTGAPQVPVPPREECALKNKHSQGWPGVKGLSGWIPTRSGMAGRGEWLPLPSKLCAEASVFICPSECGRRRHGRPRRPFIVKSSRLRLRGKKAQAVASFLGGMGRKPCFFGINRTRLLVHPGRAGEQTLFNFK